MSENPYAAVETGSQPHPSPNSLGAGPLEIARSVFLAWEKLRLVYIAIVGVPTLALVAASGNYDLSVFIMIAFGAVVSNVCYMAGPILETYVRWLGWNSLWPRAAMFIGGTCFTLIAALLSVGNFLFS